MLRPYYPAPDCFALAWFDRPARFAFILRRAIDRGSGQHPRHPRVAHGVLVADLLDRLGEREQAPAALDDFGGRPRRGEQRVVDRLGAASGVFRDLVDATDAFVGGRILIHQTPQLTPQLLGFGEDLAGLRLDRRVGFSSHGQPRDHRHECRGERSGQRGGAAATRRRGSSRQLIDPAVQGRPGGRDGSRQRGADLRFQDVIPGV